MAWMYSSLTFFFLLTASLSRAGLLHLGYNNPATTSSWFNNAGAGSLQNPLIEHSNDLRAVVPSHSEPSYSLPPSLPSPSDDGLAPRLAQSGSLVPQYPDHAQSIIDIKLGNEQREVRVKGRTPQLSKPQDSLTPESTFEMGCEQCPANCVLQIPKDESDPACQGAHKDALCDGPEIMHKNFMCGVLLGKCRVMNCVIEQR